MRGRAAPYCFNVCRQRSAYRRAARVGGGTATRFFHITVCTGNRSHRCSVVSDATVGGVGYPERRRHRGCEYPAPTASARSFARLARICSLRARLRRRGDAPRRRFSPSAFYAAALGMRCLMRVFVLASPLCQRWRIAKACAHGHACKSAGRRTGTIVPGDRNDDHQRLRGRTPGFHRNGN